jgi:hypothetical protein
MTGYEYPRIRVTHLRQGTARMSTPVPEVFKTFSLHRYFIWSIEMREHYLQVALVRRVKCQSNSRKTESSAAPVPVIAPLRKTLDAWKAKAEMTDGCWIFPRVSAGDAAKVANTALCSMLRVCRRCSHQTFSMSSCRCWRRRKLSGRDGMGFAGESRLNSTVRAFRISSFSVPYVIQTSR